MSLANESFTFDSYDPSTIRGFFIVSSDPHRPTPRGLSIAQLAYADKDKVNNANYHGKKIHAQGVFSRSSKADLQLGIQELEAMLQGVEKALVMSVAGVQTQYTATKSNISMMNQAGGYAEIDIEFTISDQYGYAVSSTSLYTYAHLVGSAYSFAVNWNTKIPQVPVFTVTINTATTSTSTNTIRLYKPTTNEGISITRAWTNGDVLEVDCKNQTVKVNGVEVDSAGSFPSFKNTEAYAYLDDFTTRNFAHTSTYQLRVI